MRDREPFPLIFAQKEDDLTSAERRIRIIELHHQGVPQHEIARIVDRSRAYVNKVIKGSLAEPEPPLLIDGMTKEDARFCAEWFATENATEAYSRSHIVASRDVAKTMGSRTLKRPDIRAALQEIMDKEIPVSKLLKKLGQHVDSRDSAVSLKAVDMGLKLHDVYPGEKRRNINLNMEWKFSPVNLSEYKNCDENEDCKRCDFDPICEKNRITKLYDDPTKQQ
jgi:hypothetical protein